MCLREKEGFKKKKKHKVIYLLLGSGGGVKVGDNFQELLRLSRYVTRAFIHQTILPVLE